MHEHHNFNQSPADTRIRVWSDEHSMADEIVQAISSDLGESITREAARASINVMAEWISKMRWDTFAVTILESLREELDRG